MKGKKHLPPSQVIFVFDRLSFSNVLFARSPNLSMKSPLSPHLLWEMFNSRSDLVQGYSANRMSKK